MSPSVCLFFSLHTWYPACLCFTPCLCFCLYLTLCASPFIRLFNYVHMLTVYSSICLRMYSSVRLCRCLSVSFYSEIWEQPNDRFPNELDKGGRTNSERRVPRPYIPLFPRSSERRHNKTS